MAPGEAERVFGDYFAIFPWDQLPPNAEGFDMGCGSGRWARFVAPRVGRLLCIDPSSALAVARSTLADQPNVQFHQASVAASGLPPNSQDFGYSLGVLHHVPDTAAAIRSCAELLKPGAPLLLYLYYAFDNRPRWFRLLWRLSNAARLLIRRLPPRPKQLVTDLIALTIYWPLSRLASLAEAAGLPVASFPLSYTATAASTPWALTRVTASAPPWSGASAAPRSARCAAPLGWWSCGFLPGLPIGAWLGLRVRERA